MKKTLNEIEAAARNVLQRHGIDPAEIATNCAWLHGAGYNGLKYILEAVADDQKSVTLERDALGLDLKNVSCAFIFPAVEAQYAQHGRLFLRNVRHGLFMLHGSVEGNYGIGCPVDPSFALGGERTKNPYAEKLELAGREGVEVDDDFWQSLNV